MVAPPCDDAAVLREVNAGVQVKIKEIYLNAHLHCYAHQLSLVLQKAASLHSWTKIFFNDLSGISAFFQNHHRGCWDWKVSLKANALLAFLRLGGTLKRVQLIQCMKSRKVFRNAGQYDWKTVILGRLYC